MVAPEPRKLLFANDKAIDAGRLAADAMFFAVGAAGLYFVLRSREIAARVETALALQASERRFRRLVETVPKLLFFITNPARDRASR